MLSISVRFVIIYGGADRLELAFGLVADLVSSCVELLAFNIDLVFRVSLESIDFAMVSGLHHIMDAARVTRRSDHIFCGHNRRVKHQLLRQNIVLWWLSGFKALI